MIILSSDKNNEWRFKITEWRGYVIRSLEIVNKKLDDLSIQQKELKSYVNEEITSNKKRIILLETQDKITKVEYSIYKKMGIFILGLVASGIAAIGFGYISKLLGG